MIRPRTLPDAPRQYAQDDEQRFRRVVADHMREVANDDRSFRARFVSGQVASVGGIAAGGTAGLVVSGFDGTKAHILLTPSGGGENGADPGAVEAWITARTQTGCTVNYRNTASVVQSVVTDWLAIVPEA